MRVFFFLAFSLSYVLPASAQEDELLPIVQAELAREMQGFAKHNDAPYYIGYRIDDIHSAHVTSSFGSLVNAYADRNRILVTDLRVGDYTFDNTHPIGNYDNVDLPDEGMGRGGRAELPLDNKKEAIQFALWQQTENAYKEAVAMYKALKNSSNRPAEVPLNDFSKEEPAKHIDPALPDFNQFFDRKAWEEKIKKFSRPFLANANIAQADASLEAGMERKYFVSSEGAAVVQNRTYGYLTINASVLAEDGDIVPLHLSYFAFEPKDLPADEVILADIDKMITKLDLLRKAPLAEPYSGPAILHARAAGVFFHEIFGHRIEGHRLKDESDGQTFKGKVKQQVLPKTLSVISDPTLPKFDNQALNGFYQYDDEGVKAQKVNVVENGVLKTFLMSRSPIETFDRSNGHGRAQAGADVVSRQSNLIVENQKKSQMADLRKMLISECKKQKKKYGYLFMDVAGGFTTTTRHMPNAFNIYPLEVYRVYIDGRPDELVRGVDLIGTPLAMFAEIAAADDKREVFTGFCGAESGSVPVTAIAPSLFVKRIETQKKATQQVEKPLLERPQASPARP